MQPAAIASGAEMCYSLGNQNTPNCFLMKEPFMKHSHLLKPLSTLLAVLFCLQLSSCTPAKTTAEAFDDFVEELARPDVTYLAEIYAAREQNTLGISSLDLVRKIPGAVYCPHLEGVTAQLADMAGPGDLILTVGAGDIYLAGENLVQKQ